MHGQTKDGKEGEQMSIGLNHLSIAGNLTRDPETKYLPSDKIVCKFTVANSQTYMVNGEKREDVVFLDCTAWAKTAETIGKHFKKGKPIIVEGKLKQENWEDKDTGAKRSKICLTVDRFHFVPDGKGRSEGESGGDEQPVSVQAEHMSNDPPPAQAPSPRQSNEEEPPF